MANRAGFYPADLRSTRSAGTAGTTCTTCTRTTCSSSAERLAHTEEAVGAAPTTSTIPPGAHNPREPGAVPGPATIVRTVAPPRRRAARSGLGLSSSGRAPLCKEEAVGSSPTGSTSAGSDHPGAPGGRHRPAMPRWWNGQHASPSRRRSPVRSRYGVRPPQACRTTRRRWTGRRGGTQTRRPKPRCPVKGVGVQVPPSALCLPPRRAPGLCIAGSGGRHPGEALAAWSGRRRK